MIIPLDLLHLDSPLGYSAQLTGLLRLPHYRQLRRWYQYLLQPLSPNLLAWDISSSVRLDLLLPAKAELTLTIQNAIKTLDLVSHTIQQAPGPLAPNVLAYYHYLLQERHQDICRLLYFEDSFRLRNQQELVQQARRSLHLPREHWLFSNLTAPQIPRLFPAQPGLPY